jgi:hypothetical protein
MKKPFRNSVIGKIIIYQIDLHRKRISLQNLILRELLRISDHSKAKSRSFTALQGLAMHREEFGI